MHGMYLRALNLPALCIIILPLNEHISYIDISIVYNIISSIHVHLVQYNINITSTVQCMCMF